MGKIRLKKVEDPIDKRIRKKMRGNTQMVHIHNKSVSSLGKINAALRHKNLVEENKNNGVYA